MTHVNDKPVPSWINLLDEYETPRRIARELPYSCAQVKLALRLYIDRDASRQERQAELFRLEVRK